jgi:hypothetical protein
MVPLLLFLILLVLAWPYLLMTGIALHVYTNTAFVTAIMVVAAVLVVLKARKQKLGEAAPETVEKRIEPTSNS